MVSLRKPAPVVRDRLSGGVQQLRLLCRCKINPTANHNLRLIDLEGEAQVPPRHCVNVNGLPPPTLYIILLNIIHCLIGLPRMPVVASYHINVIIAHHARGCIHLFVCQRTQCCPFVVVYAVLFAVLEADEIIEKPAPASKHIDLVPPRVVGDGEVLPPFLHV